MRFTTIDSRLKASGGHPSGFDYLRIFLAAEVLAWHTVLMSYGHEVQNDMLNTSLLRAIPALILPMFFALSGFLVAGSLDRSHSFLRFMVLRFLRIFPALCIVVVLSAVVLGPLITVYSIKDYFSDPLFGKYFLTLLGIVQNELPGVFVSNPFPTIVNGQLWTIPREMLCYTILGCASVVGIFRRPYIFLFLALIGQLLFAFRVAFGDPIIWGNVPPNVLYLCFFAGSTFYLFKNVIPFHLGAAMTALTTSIIIIYIPGGAYFVAFPVAYATVCLGLLSPPKTFLVKTGDYSYGLYLFAFPIQQLMAMQTTLANEWYINLGLSLPVSLAVAYCSWHLVEKNALKLKNIKFKGVCRFFSIKKGFSSFPLISDRK